MREVAITTVDNPYNPLEKFEEWYEWDESHGYHTCSYLSRIAKPAESLGNSLYIKHIEEAIDEIVRDNPTLQYKKVVREVGG